MRISLAVSQWVWRFALAPICFVFSACTTPAPTYRYQAAAADPVISLESDFQLHTHFFVNTRNPAANRCEDFDRAGYLLKIDSIFLYDKSNREITIRTAANNPIAISAEHYFDDPGQIRQCGPLLRVFTPMAGGKYVARMNDLGGFCSVTIDRLDEKSGNLEIVASSALPRCTQ